MMSCSKYLIICIIYIFVTIIGEAFGQANKGQATRMHSIQPRKPQGSKPGDTGRQLIGFASLLPYEQSDPETKSAFDFISANHDLAVEFVTIGEIVKRTKTLARYAIVWIHRMDTTVLSPAETNPKLVRMLQAYVASGGRLLLTLRAVHFLNVLGYEPVSITDSTKKCIDDGNGRKLGIHAFRDHPVFDGLHGGAYINRPMTDQTTRISGFFGAQVPSNGKVLAVDWDYIFLREQSKIVFEYTPGKGKVVAVGGYINFGTPNLNRPHLELFTLNCIRYLSEKNTGIPSSYWDYTMSTVTRCPEPAPTDQLLKAIPPPVKWAEPDAGLNLTKNFGSGNFWDVAGERLLTMGTEKGGIEEVWAHPFMAFRDYEAGIRFAYKDTIYWLDDERPEIVVNPAYFSRQYKFPRAYLREMIVNDPGAPSGVIHYEYRGVYPAELIIRLKTNLRLMWPYSENATGSLCYSWDPDTYAFMAENQGGNMFVKLGGNRYPARHLEGAYDGFGYSRSDSSFHGIPTDKIQASCLLQYPLEMNDNLDIVYTAGSEGKAAINSLFETALRHPSQIYANALIHSYELLSKSLLITSPDENFNTGYRWALVSADRFFVNTPGMGKALVAGYSTTRHGWDGGHKVNGRPGYGWYFGRDGEWSSFALLDYGDFGKVKSELEFFNNYQDLTGKILHEASTSGIIHYDAADATPLYIVLAGKYFRHTNDTAFLRRIWPNVKHAIQFCYSTDTDHDHLIENTNVGHGWVEGGELYGSHATLYMAGSWFAALTEASNMAAFMHDPDGPKYGWESEEVRNVINTSFWSDQQKFFAYGKNRDGSYRREPTVLPAVPILFKAIDPSKATICLKQYAGNAFSTNWGVRIIRDDSRWFKPTGYHYGSVWPLFTGWVSLAEYGSGNYLQGYTHMMNNLDIYKNWGLGFTEEVLNGAEYQPSGVCAHQCWSETMVLQPALEGMLGLDVRAQENKLGLSPRLPAQWDSLDVRNIRIDSRSVDFHFHRQMMNRAETPVYTSDFDFSLAAGKSLHIEFMPVFPPATQINRVTLDGHTAPFVTFKTPQGLTLLTNFELRSTSRLTVDTGPGISLLPVESDPKPGEPSEGLRIIETHISRSGYQVTVEGKSGSSGIIEIYSPASPMEIAENARFLDQKNGIYRFAVDFEKSTDKYVEKNVTFSLK